jgi:hypothetical protein
MRRTFFRGDHELRHCRLLLVTTSEVEDQMGTGPSRFENIADTKYSTWYWGDDYRVLFQDQKVISKDSTHTKKTASIAGNEYEERRMAQCLAPGHTSEVGTTRVINIPGVGTIQIPLAAITPSEDQTPKQKD